MLVTAFVPPSKGSPYHVSVTGFHWYIAPVIGITGPLSGILYYWGLLAYERKSDKQLVVKRTPFWMKDPDCPPEYVQKAEVIDHVWQTRPRAGGDHSFAQDEGAKEPVTRQQKATPSEDGSGPDHSGPFGPTGRQWNGFGTATMNGWTKAENGV